MVKTKGSINSHMAQLVEVALEEESAIRSERFRRNPPEQANGEPEEQRYTLGEK